MTKPTEPTLTCSEVVERLRNEAYVAENWIVKRKSSFDVTKAEAILHSWRERRVQELEEQIAKRSGCSHCNDSASNSESARAAKETR